MRIKLKRSGSHLFNSIIKIMGTSFGLAYSELSEILRNCFTKEELYITLMNIFKYDFNEMILCSARVDARCD